jgi:hypothetical protein
MQCGADNLLLLQKHSKNSGANYVGGSFHEGSFHGGRDIGMKGAPDFPALFKKDKIFIYFVQGAFCVHHFNF